MDETFPGASDTDLDGAAYAIVGAPLDVSTTFYPGTRFGPGRIRHFARGFEDFDHDTGQAFTDLGVVDRGNVHPWADVEDYIGFVTGVLTDVRTAGAVPILLGGEHTVSVAGVRATTPAHVVCVDAHLDLRERFDDDPWSHATAIHHLLEIAERVTILGARAASEPEWDRARRSSAIDVVAPEDVSDWLARPLDDRLGDGEVYLSLDIDGIDPSAAPATGTLEPFGLTAPAVREIVRTVASAAVGFDVVEVNDRDDGQTATLAAKLVREFVYHHADHQ